MSKPNRVKKAPTSVYDLDKGDLAAQVDLAVRTAAPIFRLFGWTWGTPEVPSEIDIRNDIDEKICVMLADNSTTGLSSGRLEVKRSKLEPTGFAILLDLT